LQLGFPEQKVEQHFRATFELDDSMPVPAAVAAFAPAFRSAWRRADGTPVTIKAFPDSGLKNRILAEAGSHSKKKTGPTLHTAAPRRLPVTFPHSNVFW
jgi:hypothetical protein